MRRLAAVSVALIVGPLACVWNKPNLYTQESSAPLTLGGWTYGPSQAVSVSARDWNTNALRPIVSTTSGTIETIAGSGMYPWEVTIPAAMFATSNWRPTALGPAAASAGWVGPTQLDLTVTQVTTPMLTFSGPAETCAVDKMNAGMTQQQAGQACSDGKTLTLSDPSGLAVAPAALAWTNVGASTRVALPSETPFIVQVVSYQSGGNTVFGMICRPDDASPVPRRTMIFNHGGGTGTGNAWDTVCKKWAQHGWVVGLSAYRGEPLVTPAAWGLPVATSLASGGAVEVSLGEVTDVQRFVDGMRALTTIVNTTKLFLWGHSHGASITLRALEQGIQVRAAAARAPATTWSDVYNDCKGGPWPNGVTTVAPLCSCLVSGCSDEPSLPATLGGFPPATVLPQELPLLPRSYEFRSPLSFAKDLKVRSDVTLLIQHGIADNTVQVGQSCALALATWSSTFAKAWHAPSSVAIPTSVSTLPIADCDGLTFQPAPRPNTSAAGTWLEKSSYLVVYDGLGHGLDLAMGGDTAAKRDFENYVSFLESTWGM